MKIVNGEKINEGRRVVLLVLREVWSNCVQKWRRSREISNLCLKIHVFLIIPLIANKSSICPKTPSFQHLTSIPCHSSLVSISSAFLRNPTQKVIQTSYLSSPSFSLTFLFPDNIFSFSPHLLKFQYLPLISCVLVVRIIIFTPFSQRKEDSNAFLP